MEWNAVDVDEVPEREPGQLTPADVKRVAGVRKVEKPHRIPTRHVVEPHPVLLNDRERAKLYLVGAEKPDDALCGVVRDRCDSEDGDGIRSNRAPHHPPNGVTLIRD
jgi:hypothetical protein